MRPRILRRVLLATVLSCLLAGCTGSAPANGTSATAPVQPPPPYVAGRGSGWTLSFDAGFSGNRLNSRTWDTCYPWGSPDGCTNFGNSHEYEWYTPSQAQVYAGALHLVAQPVPIAGQASNGASKEYSFRSGMVTTFHSYRFQYGYVQVVARVPYATGLWPALWLAAANEQWPPEIDIMEHYGTQDGYSQHLHPVGLPVQGASESTPNLSSGWHTLGLYWSPDELIWYVDGSPVTSARIGVPHQPMYFIANLAVYQQAPENWGAGSAALVLRSVKVWQGKRYEVPARLTLPPR